MSIPMARNCIRLMFADNLTENLSFDVEIDKTLVSCKTHFSNVTEVELLSKHMIEGTACKGK